MEYEYIEYHDYWFYRDTIFIKHDFNKDFTDINFEHLYNKIIFSESENINHLIDKYYTHKQNIKEINYTYRSSFNRNVDNLPNNITHIIFGCYFNKTVDNLPITLSHLIFGENFNQNVDSLPNSLTHISFNLYFNQPVDNLPNSLIKIKFYNHINCPYTHEINCLPDSIEIIILDVDYCLPIDKFPENLKIILCSASFIKNNKIKSGVKIVESKPY